MSKARELAELGAVYDSGALSNRNMIINGAMRVWQRGTSIAGGSISSFVYRADRFWLYAPSSTSGSVLQSTDVPSGEGFNYSLRNNLDTACNIGTNVELQVQGSDAPFVNGEQYTLSFYVKGASASSGIAIAISTRDNSGGTGSVTRASGVTFDITTSWARVEKTFTLSGTVGGSNRCLQFEFSLPVGGYVTGFQLERGSEATPFEHRSYGDELARCERYYQQWTGGGTTPYFATGRNHNSTSSIFSLTYRTEMRGRPSLSISSASDIRVYDGFDRTSTGITLNGNGTNTCGFNVNGLSSGVGNNYAAQTYFLSPNGYFALDAEL